MNRERIARYRPVATLDVVYYLNCSSLKNYGIKQAY